MQVTQVRCGDPACGRVLDEAASVAPSEREPCPDCGSLRRVVEASGTMTVRVSASAAWTRIHEEVERSWPWYLGALALTIASSLVGLVLAGVPGAFVGLVLGLLSFPASRRGERHIREIEHGGQR